MADPYPPALTHVGVTVPDLNEALRWYREVLGFQIIFGPADMIADDTHYGRLCQDLFGTGFRQGRLAFLTGANGVVLEMFDFDRPKSVRRENNFEYWKSGFFHICLVEPEIEAMVKRIEETGGKLRSKIWQLFADKPYKIAFCEDPFGNIIELNSHSTERVWSNQ
jgi:catechol 2,3-dioxygenase-like lactoylglutathione lyase family enzyme